MSPKKPDESEDKTKQLKRTFLKNPKKLFIAIGVGLIAVLILILIIVWINKANQSPVPGGGPPSENEVILDSNDNLIL